ncbi:MAG: hypothetical protein KAR56_00190 [Thermoplasmata archaeon]|nr:hypothetical protein [Thermoplasmata archaeon]
MRERRLTVRDRIVVHLASYTRLGEEFECPEGMAQAGISTAIGKSRAHTTLELNRMKDAHMVTERLAHVKGARSKRKTYNLTREALVRNSEITTFLDSQIVEIEGQGTFNGSEAMKSLLKIGYTRPLAMEKVLASNGVLKIDTLEKATAIKTGQHIPRRLEFFVPRQELGQLTDLMKDSQYQTITVLGIPGIGKTALLSELAWQDSEASIYFRSLHAYDSVQSIMGDFSAFLSSLGHNELQRYLANAPSSDLPEIGQFIGKVIASQDLTIIIDDYEHVSETLKPLFSLLMDIVSGSGSSLIVASSWRPDFYSQKDIILSKKVAEISIPPLDAGSSVEFLKLSGFNENPDKNVMLAGGHPLTLKLLASGTDASTISDYVEQDILLQDTELAELCRFSSILRKPFLADDLEVFGFKGAVQTKNHLVFERLAGGFTLHPAVNSIMQIQMSQSMLASLNEKAAKYYQDIVQDRPEAMHHLVRAGKYAEACNLIMNEPEIFQESGNQDIDSDIEALIDNIDSAGPEILWLGATIFNQSEKWAKALGFIQTLKTEYPDSPEALKGLILQANILSKKGKYSEAMQILEPITQGPDEVLSKAHNARAIILRKLGANSSALDEFKLAIELAGNDELYLARCQMEVAMTHGVMADHQKSASMLKNAIAIFESEDSQIDLIRCKINMGKAMKGLGQINDAVISLEDALALSEELALTRLMGYAMVNLSDLLNGMQNYHRSEELAAIAKDIFQDLGEPMLLSAALFNLGTAQAGRKKKAEAMKNLDAAIQNLETHELLSFTTSWIEDYAVILETLGEPEKAREIQKKYT